MLVLVRNMALLPRNGTAPLQYLTTRSAVKTIARIPFNYQTNCYYGNTLTGSAVNVAPVDLLTYLNERSTSAADRFQISLAYA